MTIRESFKIECIKAGIKINSLADQIGMSRQLMYHHLNKGNKETLKKIEKILNLKDGELSKFIQGDNL